MSAKISDDLLLVYDGQCPVCDHYCRAVKAGDVPNLQLVDARVNADVVREISERGIDVDQNMVLKVGGKYYAGPAAIHRLAQMTRSSSLFQRFNRRLFRSEQRANWLYPILRSGRNMLLKILRRTKINNLKLPDNARY